MISRRRFLQAGAVAGAWLALPFRAFPFSQSVQGIKKFVATLPGLTGTPNNSGNFIPVLKAGSTTIGGKTADLYEIVATEFTQDVLGMAAPTAIAGHKTKFWGYATDQPSAMYLGGVIVATRGTPVQVRITNMLPTSHILPVDMSLIDPASGEAEFAGRVDRIAVHLHGGFVFWDSDGGPFHWFSNANNAPGFVHGSSFANGAPVSSTGTAEGTAVYNYPNTQSARFLWYHDHAYGLTRTNAFAGLASAYLITDTEEQGLIGSGVLPSPSIGSTPYPLGIPLIVQDKTFWDPASDPNYISAVPAAKEGDLWYPWQYEGGADPDGLPPMDFPGVAALTTPNHARWGQTPVTPAPPNSSVPEYFSDTILVNGAPYPTVTVNPQRYRFRILNASQGRVYNLQLYVANDGPDGITLVPQGTLVDPNDNSIVAPSNDPGPAFIQIGNECGFLEHAVVFNGDSSVSASGTSSGGNKNSNRFLTYKDESSIPGPLHADTGIRRRVAGDVIKLGIVAGDPTIGNPLSYNLVMAPAERLDVIIDFRGFADQTLILYNDAPAPFPGGDIRNDYFVGAPDLRIIGGAPAPTAGVGPDTRIIMQIKVGPDGTSTAPGELDFAGTIAALEDPTTGLPGIFKLRGDPTLPLMPTRTLGKTLIEDNDEFGRLRQLLGDQTVSSRTYLDFPIDVAVEGEVQEWQIFNTTADTHPMHFHLVNVNVVKREQWAFLSDGTPDLSTGQMQIISGSERAPDPNEQGWKETVRMNPGEVTTVAMKFDLPSGVAETTPVTPFKNTSSRLLESYGITGAEYVWHCHILEHEEHDMMHPLVVVPGVFMRRTK